VFLKPAEEGGFVAYNPETGTTSEGEIVAEAFSNSQESTILYIKATSTRHSNQFSINKPE